MGKISHGLLPQRPKSVNIKLIPMEKLPQRLLPQMPKDVNIKHIPMGKVPQKPKSVNLVIKSTITQARKASNLSQRHNTGTTHIHILYDACLNNT